MHQKHLELYRAVSSVLMIACMQICKVMIGLGSQAESLAKIWQRIWRKHSDFGDATVVEHSNMRHG